MEGHSHILKYIFKKDTHKLGSEIDEYSKNFNKKIKVYV